MHPEGTVERVSELLAKKKHETMPKVECSGTNLSEIWHYLVVLVAKSCEPSGDTTPRKVTAVILHGVVSPETPLYDGSSGGRAPLGRSKHTLTSCASQASLARTGARSTRTAGQDSVHTTPCRMTGVALNSHVRYKEIYSGHPARGFVPKRTTVVWP